MPRSLFLTAILVLILSSCSVQYHGLRPISPIPPQQFGSAPRVVDSLQPTLSWKTVSKNGGTKYDLIIYKGVEKRIDPFSAFYYSGKEVYYREGVEGGHHRIEQPLNSNTVYVWSVRTRIGTNVGSWSTYDCQTGYVPIKYAASAWGENLWWSFRTPER